MLNNHKKTMRVLGTCLLIGSMLTTGCSPCVYNKEEKASIKELEEQVEQIKKRAIQDEQDRKMLTNINKKQQQQQQQQQAIKKHLQIIR